MSRPILKILLIEDDLDDQYLVRAMLSRVRTFSPLLDVVPGIEAAREVLAKGTQQVILVDNFLDGGSGLDLVRDRRAIGDRRPFILLTGQGGPDLDMMALSVGASDYLQKGRLDPELLERAIRYSLRQVEAAEDLLRAQERFRLYFENAVEGIFRVDADGNLLDGNPALARILGGAPWQETESQYKLVDHFVHPSDIKRLMRLLRQIGSVTNFEAKAVTLQGEPLWISLNCRLAGHGPSEHIEGSVTDIGQRKEIESQIMHAALHDALTGLPNRVLLMDRLGAALRATARRESEQVCLMLIDIDDFKNINDSLGHTKGDRLLMHVGTRIERMVRQEDTLSRLGGDEFGLVITAVTTEAQATSIASKVLACFEEPFELEGIAMHLKASMGVALGRIGQQSEEILRHADIALQTSKSQGKNCLRIFDQGMQDKVQRLMDLENEMRESLRHSRFHVEYQPIIDMRLGNIIGFEALLRWRHPVHGAISPAEFIPVAENSGMIVELGRFVLHEACRQAAQWRAQGFGDLVASVNVSGRQFQSDDLLELVETALQETGLPGHLLKLEMTESVAMINMDTIVGIMDVLDQKGVHFAIDDFGTGYSSLSYLKRFSCDTLKIDRSFVRDLPSHKDDCEIVRAILALARTLEMDVVAEGIETREQFEFLRDEGCDSFQGFLASRPVHADTFQQLLMRTTPLVESLGNRAESRANLPQGV